MTQRNQGIDINSPELDCNKKCFKKEKRAIDVMIKGYQEMAEINLKISKLCFEVESEADDIYIRLTECD
ncbi:MAG: hypothetical protein GX366_02400 [Epulopiscium sp.]|nr:hypothetical protein [Candidatus Epulonipiscium sp.]